MLISGTYIPAQKYLPADTSRQERNQPDAQRERSIAQQRRQETVEYIFQGELEDEPTNAASSNQVIDPANANAIASYNDTAAASPFNVERRGQLLDIFL